MKPIGSIGPVTAAYFDRRLHAITLGIERELKRESPVGNPKHWKSGRARPGYSGGQFKRSWRALYFRGRFLGIVVNGVVYAAVLARNIGPKTGTRHSKKIPPDWINKRLPVILQDLAAAANASGGLT